MVGQKRPGAGRRFGGGSVIVGHDAILPQQRRKY